MKSLKNLLEIFQNEFTIKDSKSDENNSEIKVNANPKKEKPFLEQGIDLTLSEIIKLSIPEIINVIFNGQKIAKEPFLTYHESYGYITEEINKYNEYSDNIYGQSIESKLMETLIKNGFTANSIQIDFIDVHIKDILFINYFRQDKNQNEVISFIIDFYNEYLFEKNISSLAKLVSFTIDDLRQLSKVAFYGKENKRIDLYIWDDIEFALLEKHRKFSGIVYKIMNLTKWDEPKARLIISNFFIELSKDLSHFRNPISTKSEGIFNYLLKTNGTKNNRPSTKANSIRVLFELLQPIIPGFHCKEEYMKSRNHTTLDKQSYYLHQRDSINQLLGYR